MAELTLTIPDEIIARARDIAALTHQSIESVLTNQLVALNVDAALLQQQTEAALTALTALTDDELWAMARQQLPESVQHRMESLADKLEDDTLTETEMQERLELLREGDKLMLSKARAMAALTRRGYVVSDAALG